MGGFGSGRWQHGKDKTEDYLDLDIRKLNRERLIVPDERFMRQWTHRDRILETIGIIIESAEQMIIIRLEADNWTVNSQLVKIEWTPCSYGGQRPWFICPVKACGRRVAILYGGDVFACRHCYQLAYACQCENTADRKLRKAKKIRRKLGGSANMLEPFPQKPKGMYWRTYLRLEDQHYEDHWASLVGMSEKLGIKMPTLYKD